MKLIIAGKSGSGKTTFAKKLAKKRNLKLCTSFTTRKKRKGEVTGIDYHFVDNSFFDLYKQDMIAVDCYDGAYYGIYKTHFHEADIFILTPKGIKELPQDEIVVHYVDVSDENQFKRLMKRYKDEDKVWARMEEDRVTFKNFKYDI